MSNLNQKFCHHCGAVVPYTANFCVSCGTSLSSLGAKPTPPPAPTPTFTPFTVSKGRDDDSYLDRIEKLDIKINRLELDITGPIIRPNEEKLGSFAASGPSSANLESRPMQNLTPEQFKEQFNKEAGSINRGEKSHSIQIDEK